MPTVKPGVLCLQGSFAEHLAVLRRLGHEPVRVRSVEDLANVTHLILPGGESTVIRKLMELNGLWGALLARIASKNIRIMGTCAGAILAAPLGFPLSIERNAYGAQLASGTFPLESDVFSDLFGTFIRAPRFVLQDGQVPSSVRVLAERNGHPEMLENDTFVCLTFHPELGDETRIHEHFLND